MEVSESAARADSVSVKIFWKQLMTSWVTSESRMYLKLEAKGGKTARARRWGRLDTAAVQNKDLATSDCVDYG